MDFKEKVESTLITRTFNVSGMPETVFQEVNAFCKEFYGDSRWTMIADLMRFVKDDYRYNLLYEEVQELKAQVASMSSAGVSAQQEQKPKTRYGTFGGN